MKQRTDGYNPMRHDCDKNGCWNKLYRPRIEFFAEVLPRNIGMTDIDATVEVGGHFLIMEWKSHDAKLQTGQKIYFERLTALSEKITVVVVSCENHPEDITSCQVIKGGKLHHIEQCDFDGLQRRVKNWADKVEGNRFKPDIDFYPSMAQK